MRMIHQNIKNILSVICTLFTILSFYGYSGENKQISYLIFGILLLFIIIIINRHILLKIMRRIIKIDYSNLQRDTELVPSLIDSINNKNRNNVYADIITYSYKKLSEKNELEILVDIDGISNYNNIFTVSLLDKNENTNISVICNKNSIDPYSIKRENNYTEYFFNLPNLQRNLKIKIVQQISANKNSNLYFIPNNYVNEVNNIKIKTGKKVIGYYKIEGRKYSSQFTLDVKNGKIQLNGREHIKSIFIIKDYKN